MEMDEVQEFDFDTIDVVSSYSDDSYRTVSNSDEESATTCSDIEDLLSTGDELMEEYPQLQIVTREAWGAREPFYKRPLPHPIPHTLFSYANIPPCTNRRDCMKAMRDLQNKNMDQDDLGDIQYNFYMAPDLTVYEGRGWHVSSEETYKYYKSFDGKKFDICYLGHVRCLTGDNVYPSPHVEVMRKQLLDYGLSQGYIEEDINCIALHQ